MAEKILTPDQMKNMVSDLTTLIGDKGITTVNSAVLIAMVIMMFIFGLGLTIYFIKSSQKSQKLLMDTHVNFSNAVLTEIKNGFQAVDASIKGVYTVINNGRQFDRYDFKNIATISTTNTILRIYIKLMLIIERNNLVINQDSIMKDIENTINAFVEEGRELLNSIGFEENILELFFIETDKLKANAILEIKQHFIVSIFKITDLQDILDKKRKESLTTGSLNAAELDLYEHHRQNLTSEYNQLKRSIFTVCELMINGTKEKLREMTKL